MALEFGAFGREGSFSPFLFGIYSYRRFIYFLVLIFNLDISFTAFCVHRKGPSSKSLTRFATKRPSSWQAVAHATTVKL